MKLSFQFSCGANCIHRRFLITQFLAMKLWVRIPLQIGDRQSVGTLPLFVRQLSTLCYRGILRLNSTSILCSQLYGLDWLQTYRYKTREPWGVSVSKLFTLFVKMLFEVIYRYLESLFIYKKISNIFFKKPPFIFKDAKNHRNRLIQLFLSKNAINK